MARSMLCDAAMEVQGKAAGVYKEKEALFNLP
jgi:hypothetical protein